MGVLDMASVIVIAIFVKFWQMQANLAKIIFRHPGSLARKFKVLTLGRTVATLAFAAV